MAENTKFNTLADFLESIGYETVDDQFVIHKIQEVTPLAPYQSATFRANYFTFVLLKDGRSRYTLDSITYEVKPNTLYFTNPGHLKSFEILKPIDGFLISFSEEYLNNFIEPNSFNIFPYLLSEIVPPQYLSQDLFNDLWQISERIQEELDKSTKLTPMMIASYFKIFLLKVNENLYKDYDPIDDGDRNSEIVRTFKINLEQNLKHLLNGEKEKMNQVSEFAEIQHLHPAYFSTVIKTKTGKSVSDWIVDRIIQEAKSQLQGNRKSVKEIAFVLGFTEANYFSKYFKKYTGLTPSQFRKR